MGSEEIWISHTAKPCGQTEIPIFYLPCERWLCLHMKEREENTHTHSHTIPACVSCWLWSGGMLIGTALPVSWLKVKIQTTLILAWFGLLREVKINLTELFNFPAENEVAWLHDSLEANGGVLVQNVTLLESKRNLIAHRHEAIKVASHKSIMIPNKRNKSQLQPILPAKLSKSHNSESRMANGGVWS